MRTCRKLRVRIPERVIAAVDEPGLPEGWAAPGLHPVTREVGDRWLASRKSAVLPVPSAVVAGEVNCVLDPTHPDFADVEAGGIGDSRFDSRIVKTE